MHIVWHKYIYVPIFYFFPAPYILLTNLYTVQPIFCLADTGRRGLVRKATSEQNDT